MTREFIDNGRLKVVNELDKADLILKIIVNGYANKPYEIENNLDVSKYRIEITLNIECLNVKENAPLLSSSSLTQFKIYDYESENEDAINEEIIKKHSEEIVIKILSVW